MSAAPGNTSVFDLGELLTAFAAAPVGFGREARFTDLLLAGTQQLPSFGSADPFQDLDRPDAAEAVARDG